MFTTLFIVAGSANINTNKQAVSYELDSYEEFLKEYGQKLYEKCPVMLRPIQPAQKEDEYTRVENINVPSEFSWLDNNGLDWSTSVKHQRNCGSCWDFAAVGSLEARIKIAENLPDLPVDLSEQYVLSCLSDAGSCYGGSGIRALRYIMDDSEIGNNCNGIIPEECMEYQADHSINCSEKCQDWQDKLVPISEVFQLRPDGSDDDREQIKNVIFEKGPVATHIAATQFFSYWGLNNHDPDDYYPEPPSNSFTNHLVIIYGWKDDPSIGNGGYWICKNSWGEYWGYNGYFNIEYGALHIDDSMVVWADYDPEGFDWEPIANPGEPKGGEIGQDITFDASDSFDDKEIISYAWDFGDGTTSDQMQTLHSYAQNDIYTVTLTVTDSNLQTNTEIINVWVQDTNIEPVKPTIIGQKQGKEGARYDYNFSSTDPEGNDVYYYIDWGDGQLEDWIGPYKSGEEISIKHRWNRKGDFTIKAKTKDVFGDESEFSTLQISMPINKNQQRSTLLQVIIKQIIDQFKLSDLFNYFF